ncbi:hypothetical protein KL920_005290 [Ogataea angusta]|nr:hypothetical protein KL920_005290 [Ogataea angusta]
MRICLVSTPDSTIWPTAQRRVARLGPREPLLPLARQHKGSLARYCGRQRHADLDTAVSNLLIQGHSLPLEECALRGNALLTESTDKYILDAPYFHYTVSPDEGLENSFSPEAAAVEQERNVGRQRQAGVEQARASVY